MQTTTRRKILKNWQLYVMTLPAVVYLLLFQYKPMYGVLLAFKRYRASLGILGSPWVGLAHFTRLFSSYWFPIIVGNTLTLSILGLVLGFPLPILLALSLNEVRSARFRKTVQTITYAPHFISIVVLCGMIHLFLSPEYGIVNTLLGLVGIEPIFFMPKSHMFKGVYVFSILWPNTGWNSIIYFAALSSVDPALLEAAQIDGATRLQRIAHIQFPTILPTIVVLLILNCGSLLSVGYEKAFLLQTAANLSASELISTYVYKVGLVQNDYGFSTAVGLFNSVINAVMLLLVNGIARRLGETSLW
ncbi:MAG: ABC transporter permease subunit [Clostridia bacterium]